MIPLTRLNGSPLIVNGDLICYMEEAPDTVLTLVTGMKLIVEERGAVVARMVLEHQAQVLRAALSSRAGGK
jgi:flagellar protein FlbD